MHGKQPDHGKPNSPPRTNNNVPSRRFPNGKGQDQTVAPKCRLATRPTTGPGRIEAARQLEANILLWLKIATATGTAAFNIKVVRAN